MGNEDVADIRTVLAICFRDGKPLDAIDVERMLSFDMEWLSPGDAEIAVQSLISAGWLCGEENALTPSINISGVTAPLGWFPRPSRLTNPVSVKLNEETNETIISELVEETIAIDATPTKKIEIVNQMENHSDPRAKLTKRLTKFIAKTTKIEVEEVERRANRKHKSLAVATNWMCLALVAREQGLQMQEIVDALAIR
ncbi:DUF2240 family protein [Candidatus Poseidoniaceae archaeon]|nr:DUF2240 family protein [Candidatus Poseidoniaceae archaeon]|tara:strand:- start:9 stop:602 length:594 start_codon:yes stop_codon:yes gene_type:complete